MPRMMKKLYRFRRSEGVLGFNSGHIENKNRPRAHVIEVLLETVSDDYLAYLRNVGASYVFAGIDGLNCGLMLEKLYRLFGIERLLAAGGGLMNWSLVQDNMVDELSIVIAPAADGNSAAASIFEKADFSRKKAGSIQNQRHKTNRRCGPFAICG